MGSASLITPVLGLEVVHPVVQAPCIGLDIAEVCPACDDKVDALHSGDGWDGFLGVPEDPDGDAVIHVEDAILDGVVGVDAIDSDPDASSPELGVSEDREVADPSGPLFLDWLEACGDHPVENDHVLECDLVEVDMSVLESVVCYIGYVCHIYSLHIV